MTALITLLLMSGGSIIALLGFRSFYAVCQPNQVLIFYGLRGRRDGDDTRMIGYRLLKGGSSWGCPDSVDSDQGLAVVSVRAAMYCCS